MDYKKAAAPTTSESRKGRAPVRPGGLNGAKLNSTSAKTQTATEAADNYIIPYDEIPFDKAVTEGRAIIKRWDRDQMRLGEIAEQSETKKYGDRTVARLAEAFGISSCTLHRHRAVYRKWDGNGIVAPGPVSYAVKRELKDLPNREEIVANDPHITRREAEDLRHEHEGKQKNNKSRDEQQKELERWLRQGLSLANKVTRHFGGVQVTDALRQIVEPDLLPTLREAGAALLSLADQLEQPNEQLEDAA